MSHPNQLAFTKTCATLMASSYNGGKVVEIGSYAVNGDVREFFLWANEYIGVDLTNGPGVDVVSSGHEFGESNNYDVAISCEVFEHNPYWLETFLNMIRITKPGGTVLFTCATKGRMEHGTFRTDPNVSPGTSSIGWSYYRNLVKNDFIKCINLDEHFSSYHFYIIRNSYDLFFIGVKRSYVEEQNKSENWLLKSSLDLVQFVSEMKAQPKISLPKRYPVLSAISMVPVWIASHVLSDRIYQNFRHAHMKYVARFKQNWMD